MELAVKQLKKNSNLAVCNALVVIRKKLLKEQNGVSSLRESGGLKLLLYHIQKSDEKIIDVSLSILGNVCLEPESRKLVRELDGISFVVRHLESSKNESILNRSCRVLANLSLDEINGDEIHRNNAVKILIDILPSAKDVNYLQSALRALRLLSTAPRHREIVIRNGGVECLGKLLIQTTNETSENVLMGILKALSTLAVDSNSWTVWNSLKSEYVEALVSRINDPKAVVQETTLHILSNLSREDSFRPVLGNAGIVPVLIKKVNQWEASSPSWQWAVDCLCQCTREAVNRARIRQGGVEILIRLLKDSEDDRLWHRGLASIINFEYDETSFTLLVELGMVEALLEKFNRLTSIEEQAEHKDEEPPSIDLTVQLHNEIHDETIDNSSLIGISDTFNQQASPHSECYSPECSPPYWTQFWPVSPAVQPSHGYSPGRSTSPDRNEKLDEFCYSPVYDWDLSDDSDLEISSPKPVDDPPNSGVEVEEEISRTEETPVDDSKVDESQKCSDSSSSGRSPLGDILMIFSRLSLRENPTVIFLNGDSIVLAAIVDYITKVNSVQQKSVRIVNRILRNPLCLEKLILLRIPSMIIRKMIKLSHQSSNCLTCSSTSRLGESFLRELSLAAESAFGYGVIQHLLEGSTTSSEKISAAVAATLLIRSFKGRRKIFLESTGLSTLIGDFNDVEECDFNEAANGLAMFTSGLYMNVSSDVVEKKSVGVCRYSHSMQHSVSDHVDLRASDQENCIQVGREVLASKSEVFNAMLYGSFVESNQKVVVIQNACFAALKCLIHYIHSCRAKGCSVLNAAIRNESIGVICDVLALADRFLLFDIKNDIASDIMDRQRKTAYTFTEIGEIYNRSRMSNCPLLESWAISHLLTDVYENAKQRQDAFRILTSFEGSMSKDELHRLLSNELLKSENQLIVWASFKEDLQKKFI